MQVRVLPWWLHFVYARGRAYNASHESNSYSDGGGSQILTTIANALSGQAGVNSTEVCTFAGTISRVIA